MMPPSADGELLNDQELAELDSQMEAIAQEIFAKQQEKLRLQLEMDLCRAKKNRYFLSKAEGW
jgi:hypothetical protein